MSTSKPTLQEIIRRLDSYWEKQGCVLQHGYDLEVGAGTFNPATFLRSLGPEPFNVAFVEPSRRPSDGRYGENPNRMQHFFQYQVILKPSPPNMQDLYLGSLEAVGLDLSRHDIRFVHDDWESPTLGAWGLGWEVWSDGMEVTQYTYFQAVGGIPLKPISGELTYGIERLAMYLQGVDNVYDLLWNDSVTYGEIYHRNEIEASTYNFTEANCDMWYRHFQDYEAEAKHLVGKDLPLPAYEFVIKASHAFNILDARHYFSVTERTGYIGRIRNLACLVAEGYVATRESMGYPLLKNAEADQSQEAPALKLPANLVDADPAATTSFLLEIGSEELPATFVPKGMVALERSLKQLLDKAGLKYDNIITYGTPRRLTAHVSGLAMGRPETSTERRGPALNRAYDDAGTPNKAAEGFFRSLGIDAPKRDALLAGDIDNVSVREEKGEQYLYAQVTEEGSSTAKTLAEALPKLILDLDFPKKMRWGNSDIAYARPLRWVVALLGDTVLPFNVAGLTSGRSSQGHRQRNPGTVEIANAGSYVSALRERDVLVDVAERRASIEKQLEDVSKKLGATVLAVDDVMPQVLHLSEYPTLMDASFSEEYLKVPQEVLISEMVEHQKYFPLADGSGTLLPAFIITADTRPTDEIRHGNEKVLSARLADGVFLYQQDLKLTLENFNEKLKSVTHQKDLGSIYDKVERLVKHVTTLQKALSIGSLDKAQRAALLCKADLSSDMVGEFPELQGVIGRYYAIAQNEDPGVAQAIEEHWMPLGEGAPLPESDLGILLSLSEKIDNLLGCFAVGLKPTSSSDPYALRRQVLGIVRILIANKLRLPLNEVFAQCFTHFSPEHSKESEATLKDVLAFVTMRIKTVFLEYNFSKDEIEASLSGGVADIYDTFLRVQALHDFRQTSAEFPKLYEVFKRAKGQLDGQEKAIFSQDLLREDAEKRLDSSLQTLEGSFSKAVEGHDYKEAYALVAQLQQPLAQLFDEVKILDDDAAVRGNRLALVRRVFGLFGKLLDFSKLQQG